MSSPVLLTLPRASPREKFPSMFFPYFFHLFQLFVFLRMQNLKLYHVPCTSHSIFAQQCLASYTKSYSCMLKQYKNKTEKNLHLSTSPPFTSEHVPVVLSIGFKNLCLSMIQKQHLRALGICFRPLMRCLLRVYFVVLVKK